MKLKKLLKDIEGLTVKGSKEIEISGICSNSKCVAPGNLFVAKKGLTHHGSRFIPDAIAAGAVAILSDLYDPFLEGVAQIIHSDVPEIEAKLAAEFYQFPCDSLFLVGITGTNGKTTTSYLIKHLFDHSDSPCGLIGTIECIAGKHYFPPALTTPDLITNYKLFHEMVVQGCTAGVMEVSSHALDQGRVRGVEFDVAVFTNLTLDHLDYHKTMEEYAKAKAKLFSTPGLGHGVVNVDSPWAPQMLERCTAKVIRYGIENKDADLRAHEIQLSAKGTRFKVQDVTFSIDLIGRFNVYNCLAAVAVGLAKGISLEKCAEILKTFKTASGRLERVRNPYGINVFVDYAHTDDALKNVLETLREIKEGKVITVFGCGGDRDKSKRPKMGAVTEQLSDVAIVTNDNPRSEDPAVIAEEVLAGFKDRRNAILELDRAKAIEKAIRLATPSDIVLIAGKGHETYQIYSHQTFSFDDRKCASEVLSIIHSTL